MARPKMATIHLDKSKTSVVDAGTPICYEECNHLTFKLVEEEYGVEIPKVSSVIPS